MLEWLKKGIERIRKKGGVIGTTFDDLWFFKTSFKLRRDYVLSDRYTASVWAYRSINKIAENIASIPLRLYKDDKDGQPIEVRDPRWDRLFDRPNPELSFSELMKRTVMLMDTFGEAFWLLERENISQIPKSIMLLHPRHMRPAVDEEGKVVGWVYKEKVPLQDYELVIFKYYNPLNEIRGLSPLEAVALSVEQDFLATLFNRNFFEEGAVMSGFLKAPDILSEEQFKRLREQFENRHKGVSKAHRIAILEGGMDFKETQITQRDMQFVDMKKITREEIFAAFGTNPVVLGIYEDVKSYEGIKTAHRAFWQETIIPRIRLIEDTLYHKLFHFIGSGEVYPKFDLANVEALQEDFEKKVKTAKTLWEMGYPINEINRRLELGMTEVPWGDSWWGPPTIVPLASTQEKKKEKEAVKKDAFDLEHEKIRYWERYNEEVLQPLEERFKKKIKRFFFEQRAQVLDNFSKLGVEKSLITKDYAEIILDWHGELRKLRELLEKLYDEALEYSAKHTAEELGIVDFAYEPLRKEMLGTMELRIKTIPEQILNTIKKDLKLQITEGLIKGETINEIQDRIRKVYNMASSRALTIARTETVSAVMSGRVKMFQKAGVKKNMWVTAKDERVRSSHAFIDGTIQEVGKKFPNGLRFPGDPLGPPGEVINCRCVLVPVKDEFIFTTGTPVAELRVDYSPLLKASTPSVKEMIKKHKADFEWMEQRDPRLLKTYLRLPIKRIEGKVREEGLLGGYDWWREKIGLNIKELNKRKDFIPVLFHELTHLAQHTIKGKRIVNPKKILPLLGYETKFYKTLMKEVEALIEDKPERWEIIDELDNMFHKFSARDYRRDERLHKERLKILYPIFHELVNKSYTMGIPAIAPGYLKYGLYNVWELQAVLMEIRAYSTPVKGSPLWKITESLLDDIEEITLGGGL